MQTIMQTRQDIENAPKKQRLEFLEWLKGAATVTVDAANYPEDYDNDLQEGEEGYVAPDWRDQVNMRSLQSFGFGSIEELESELAAQN